MAYIIYMVKYCDICNVIKRGYMIQRSGRKDATRKRNEPYKRTINRVVLVFIDRLKYKRMDSVEFAAITSKRYSDNFK